MKGPVEVKVKVATGVATVLGFIVGILELVSENPDLLAFLPPWLQFLVISIVPGLLVFFTSYNAPHTKRPDLGEQVPPAHGPIV